MSRAQSVTSRSKMPIQVGDTVTIKGRKYRDERGKVVLIERPLEPPENQVAWLDLSPGAAEDYEWVQAHFPDSWCPDRATIHAINKFPVKMLQRIETETE